MKLKHFNLEEFNYNNEEHLKLVVDLKKSENIELMTKDLDQFIINTRNVQKEYGLSEVYAVYYENKVIGISFVNYHPEKGELKEEIEIGLGLLPHFQNKKLGSLIETELCEKLLEIYPQFDNIVARIGEDNIPSVKSAIKAGFEYIDNDEYHYKRRG